MLHSSYSSFGDGVVAYFNEGCNGRTWRESTCSLRKGERAPKPFSGPPPVDCHRLHSPRREPVPGAGSGRRGFFAFMHQRHRCPSLSCGRVSLAGLIFSLFALLFSDGATGLWILGVKPHGLDRDENTLRDDFKRSSRRTYVLFIVSVFEYSCMVGMDREWAKDNILVQRAA